MTIIFQDGFETNDFSAWTGMVGSPSVQGVVKRFGNYAMLSDVATGGFWDYAYKDVAAANEYYARAYFYLTALPSATGEIIYALLNMLASGLGMGGLQIDVFYDTDHPVWHCYNNWSGASTFGLLPPTVNT